LKPLIFLNAKNTGGFAAYHILKAIKLKAFSHHVLPQKNYVSFVTGAYWHVEEN
jgi:hypothetical protein